MDIVKKISNGAEKLLFRMACATCPLQDSCSGACSSTAKKEAKKE